ncbi:TIGR03792 family protein [Cyanobium sp. ATX 6E8]|nr:TIGR03792 family protein [Cyanobium sp. ATX 6E8]
MLLAGHADVAIAELDRPDGGFEVAVVEHLRLKVPVEARQAWIDAEKGSWEPWLTQQDGFLDRQLLWDPATEEGTLLIRWASRDQWKAIPEQDLEAVQERFEQLARQATGAQQGNPFPLVFEGELLPP